MNLPNLDKPNLNEVAREVNSLFLDSPYEGKDWEAVRIALINNLEALIENETKKAREQLAESIVSNSTHTTGSIHKDSPTGTDTFTIEKKKLWELAVKSSSDTSKDHTRLPTEATLSRKENI